MAILWRTSAVRSCFGISRPASHPPNGRTQALLNNRLERIAATPQFSLFLRRGTLYPAELRGQGRHCRMFSQLAKPAGGGWSLLKLAATRVGAGLGYRATATVSRRFHVR